MLGNAPIANVLVPTDFSESADHALARALLLPLAPTARLHLVHVLPPDLPAGASARLAVDIGAALAERVTRARTQLGRASIAVTSEVLDGEAHVEIIRRSRSVGAELIVFGQGARPIKDTRVRGSICQRVIRKGEVPVLSVRQPPVRSYRRAVVATDLSDASHQVLELVTRVLDPSVTAVDVVHALHVPFEGFVAPTAAGREHSEYRRTLERQTCARLDRLLAPHTDAGVRWRPHVREGEARAVVVREATRCEADVVAVGTHGRSGIAHLVLGSVAEWVLGNAPCDVLIANPVRPRAGERGP